MLALAQLFPNLISAKTPLWQEDFYNRSAPEILRQFFICRPEKKRVVDLIQNSTSFTSLPSNSHPLLPPPSHSFSFSLTMSTFGSLYKVHTYGESHCKSVGAIVDGIPPVSSNVSSDSPEKVKLRSLTFFLLPSFLFLSARVSSLPRRTFRSSFLDVVQVRAISLLPFVFSLSLARFDPFLRNSTTTFAHRSDSLLLPSF